jgi:hypothetical protein
VLDVLVCMHWKVTTFAVLQMWIKSLPGQGVSKDIIKLLTVDAFERVITILERYTGASKDPIPQINATKVVQDELQWTDSAVSKLLPLIYAYWLNKRNQMGKPLCRKYWPQITSADTNPRQVFRCVLFAVWSVVIPGVKADAFSFWCVDCRARDKERYKLRKQQKRNDIDAFRKMQQLRKEFATARNLLHLLLERELLREVRNHP